MIRRPPRTTRTDTLFPYTTLFRSTGVYLWGAVGRGKSMLMDLFYDQLAIQRKRRIHFHAFMLDVHARLREVRKSESGDPIPLVAEALAENTRCLAFDEMVVNNSADAMILSRSDENTSELQSLMRISYSV